MSTSPYPNPRSQSPYLPGVVVDHWAHMTYTRGYTMPSRPLGPHAHNHVPRHASPTAAEDNVPPRFELFLLGDGEKKVTEETDTRVPDASVFTFNKEDHTLGNLIRSQLFHSPHVKFSGYKVPHPLESRFILRVQTDGTLTPRAAVIQACRELVHDFALLNQEFTKEWELRKMVGADNNATAAAGTGTGTGNGAGAGTDGPANPGGAVNGGTE